MKELDSFFLNQAEPSKSCMLALRDLIMAKDKNITIALSYGMPFFFYNRKRFCYLWFHKKFRQPYIGIVNGDLADSPELIKEKRSKMKIMLIDPEKDLPVERINLLLDLLLTGVR